MKLIEQTTETDGNIEQSNKAAYLKLQKLKEKADKVINEVDKLEKTKMEEEKQVDSDDKDD